MEIKISLKSRQVGATKRFIDMLNVSENCILITNKNTIKRQIQSRVENKNKVFHISEIIKMNALNEIKFKVAMLDDLDSVNNNDFNSLVEVLNYHGCQVLNCNYHPRKNYIEEAFWMAKEVNSGSCDLYCEDLSLAYKKLKNQYGERFEDDYEELLNSPLTYEGVEINFFDNSYNFSKRVIYPDIKKKDYCSSLFDNKNTGDLIES